MKNFFQSGWAFLTVSLLCIGVACISDYKGPLAAIGVFWMIMAYIVRGHYVRKKKRERKE